MVGCSDLAWRLLLRRHGADLCYTEMLYSERFVADLEYRARKLQTCADDAPLVVQFCGTDPETLAEAARLAAPHCAAVDLNLGCPLPQACESGFGAYLLDAERRGLLLSKKAKDNNNKRKRSWVTCSRATKDVPSRRQPRL